MQVLVTGSNGFIGSNLVKKLILKNFKVKALVLRGTNRENIENLGCEIIEGDILDISSFKKELKGIDVIYHLAAKVSDWGKWKDFYKLNVEATNELIKESVKNDVKRFIFVSSLAIHKPCGFLNGDENTPRDNTNFPYALSKIMAEDIVNEYSSKRLIEGVVIRPGLFPFGPEDRTSFFHIAQALEKRYFGYINGGKSILCTSYVENLVDGMILCAYKENLGGKTYILSDGYKISWKELIELFSKYLNVLPPKISIPYYIIKPTASFLEILYRLFKFSSSPPLTKYRVSICAKDFFFTPKKAIEELGYNPQISIEEGIKKTVEWYKTVKKLD